jgi:hypothetical protein
LKFKKVQGVDGSESESESIYLHLFLAYKDIEQLLNEVEHDMKNYQARSLPLSTEAEG